MLHSFEVGVAIKYGIDCALILGQIDYWCLKNKEKNRNFHDGKYWTYNSINSFTTMFPYLTSRQINYTLEKLKKAELILTNNFNITKMNRTVWYTLSDKGLAILQNCKMDNTKLSNGNDKIVKCIYKDIQTNKQISTNIKERNIKERKEATSDSFYSEER